MHAVGFCWVLIRCTLCVVDLVMVTRADMLGRDATLATLNVSAMGRVPRSGLSSDTCATAVVLNWDELGVASTVYSVLLVHAAPTQDSTIHPSVVPACAGERGGRRGRAAARSVIAAT